jgi:hypothetical protein
LEPEFRAFFQINPMSPQPELHQLDNPRPGVVAGDSDGLPDWPKPTLNIGTTLT